MCVGNDDDVRAVITGADGVLSGLSAGTILVDHTTASAQVAREMHAAAAAKDVAFLDAPVSGGQAGAENGKLTIMVGGEAAVFARAEAVLATYARAVTLMGASGSGQLTKMVNQICIAGMVQALSEGINFASRAGLDPAATFEVLARLVPSLEIRRAGVLEGPPSANAVRPPRPEEGSRPHVKVLSQREQPCPDDGSSPRSFGH